MIDLVGDDESQLPEGLVNKAIIANGFGNITAHIHEFVSHNKDKKIIIFCEKKDEVRTFENNQ